MKSCKVCPIFCLIIGVHPRFCAQVAPKFSHRPKIRGLTRNPTFCPPQCKRASKCELVLRSADPARARRASVCLRSLAGSPYQPALVFEDVQDDVQRICKRTFAGTAPISLSLLAYYLSNPFS